MLEQTDEELLAEALQSIESLRTGGLVTSFVAMAEIASPEHPDGAAYRTFMKGSPAMMLGLSSYLSSEVHSEVLEGQGDR